jgi:broad specificity phosphatase PhoE
LGAGGMEDRKEFMSSKITIFFLRHGHSLGDENHIHEGRFDTPLTALGRGQAKQRAQETAAILANELSVPIELAPLWMENGQ